MKTTTPIKTYVITALLALVIIILFVYYRFTLKQQWLSDVLLGLGTGGISSTLVALFIDNSNTKKHDNEEKKIFNRLTADFDIACEDLLTEFVIAAQEAYGADEKKRTYNEWATMLLQNDTADEKTLYEADYALQQVSEIEKQAKILLRDCKIHMNNQNIDEEFVGRVKKIQYYCQRIEREHKRGKYKNCLGIIVKELVKALSEYKPSMSKLFVEPFNWEEQ